MELTGEQRALKARCETVGRVLRFFAAWYTALTVLGIAAILLLLVVKAEDAFAVELTQNGLQAVYQAPKWTFLAGTGLRLPASVSLSGAEGHAKTLFGLAGLESSAEDLILSAALWFLRDVFTEIDRVGTPFTARCVASIRRIGWAVLAVSLLKSVLYPVVLGILLGCWSVSLVSIPQLLCCGIFFCLAAAFEYGASLQRQADETL